MNMGSYQVISQDVKIGKDVSIFHFVNLYGCIIGDGCKIGSFVEIQKNVLIGKNCKVSSHSFICEGVEIDDNVFIGHSVTFINDLFPRATRQDGSLQTESDWVVIPTRIRKNASIGSGSTILAGIEIGQNAIIGAGSVVTKSVPDNAIVAGNPARLIRMVK